MNNLILDTDSYKSSHFLQYPPGMTSMFSYFESRGGIFDNVVFFGLQYYLKKYLTQQITTEMVEEAKDFFEKHGEPFPYEGWKHIVNSGGHLPVRIRSVKEGFIVLNHNVLMTVESTDTTVPWIVGWLETMLVRVWYPITVATLSWHIKQMVLKYLIRTSDDPNGEIKFKLHDFGSRGVSSRESAEIGGMAHLVNFYGSDTAVGVWAANHYYNCDMAAFSIPAAEHSTITAWGKDKELDAYKHILLHFAKPGKMVACVSDSYDIFNAVGEYWCKELKQTIIDSGAIIVIRPDSGNPPSMVLSILLQLEKAFGVKINACGYKVLNHVRVIQGDGINYNTINDILSIVTANGFSAENVTFGMGGALLQQVNRDTQKFAYKCSSIDIKGNEQDVYKDPRTDPSKKSKMGRLDLVRRGGAFSTEQLRWKQESFIGSEMETVFLNGELLVDQDFNQIRKLAG